MSQDLITILKAAKFAAEKHRKQLRKGAESTPYINHPLEVARMLAPARGEFDQRQRAVGPNLCRDATTRVMQGRTYLEQPGVEKADECHPRRGSLRPRASRPWPL